MGNRFSDEELTAFLDGEKAHTPFREIEKALETDEELQRRLQSLDINKNDIAKSMDMLLENTPEAPAFETQAPANENSGWFRNSMIAACAASLIIFSGIVGYSIPDRQVDSWREYVAAYHYLYITSTLSSVDSSTEVAIAELETVGDAIGKQFQLENLKQFAGLEYKRSQILGFEGKPLAQLTFLSKMGTPIALCIIRSGSNEQEAISDATMEGMASASWARDGYEFLIIGGKDQVMIEEAAKHFAALI